VGVTLLTDQFESSPPNEELSLDLPMRVRRSRVSPVSSGRAKATMQVLVRSAQYNLLSGERVDALAKM